MKKAREYYWAINNGKDIVSPVFNTVKAQHEWEKQHRVDPKKPRILMIDGKVYDVCECRGQFFSKGKH